MILCYRADYWPPTISHSVNTVCGYFSVMAPLCGVSGREIGMACGNYMHGEGSMCVCHTQTHTHSMQVSGMVVVLGWVYVVDLHRVCS